MLKKLWQRLMEQDPLWATIEHQIEAGQKCSADLENRVEQLEAAVAALQQGERKAIATAVQRRAWHKQQRMLEATDGFRVTE